MSEEGTNGNLAATERENTADGDATSFWKLWEEHERFLYRICLHQLDGIEEEAEVRRRQALGSAAVFLHEVRHEPVVALAALFAKEAPGAQGDATQERIFFRRQLARP